MARPTWKSIIRTLDLFDKKGEKAFLKKYANSYGSRSCYVQHNGKRYPAKAIWAAAHRPPAHPPEFNTDEAERGLSAAGFTIEKTHTHKSDVTAIHLIVRRQDKKGNPLNVREETDSIQDFEPEANCGDHIAKRVSKLCKVRLGQPEFRKTLLYAYDACCAITKCKTEAVLEAAHIIPYGAGMHDTMHVQNGILLRADLHTLFDSRLIAFLPTKKGIVIKISKLLLGTEYKKYNGKLIYMPKCKKYHPSKEALKIRIKVAPLLDKANAASS